MQIIRSAALPLVGSLVLNASALAQGLPEAPEPNDTAATATVLTPGQQAYGDITAGDEDWFAVTLTADRDYNIWTSPGFSGAIGDTRVRIVESDGVTVVVDVDDGNTGTHGYYTTVQGTLTAGTYFIAVRGYDATTVGSYTLDAVFAPLGTYVPALAPAVEGAENNDPRPSYGSGTPTPAALATLIAGEILTGGGGASYTEPTADYDFYELQLAAATTLDLETVTGAASPALSDSVLFLVDDTFGVITADDDSGAGLLSRIVAPVAAGTYYVVVKGWGPGNYDLAITGALPVGSVVTGTTACSGSAGVPNLDVRRLAGGEIPERPILGSTFYCDGTNLPPSTLVVRVVGLLKLPTPVSLAAFGSPNCFFEVDQINQTLSLTDATGTHFWGIDTPADPAFNGLPVEQQLIGIEVVGGAFSIVSTNTLSTVYGQAH